MEKDPKEAAMTVADMKKILELDPAVLIQELKDADTAVKTAQAARKVAEKAEAAAQDHRREVRQKRDMLIVAYAHEYPEKTNEQLAEIFELTGVRIGSILGGAKYPPPRRGTRQG